jgi:addiction module HigA family antidote
MVSVLTMVRVPTDRQPTHPGIILLEEFLETMDISQTELAKAINVPYQRINDLINGRRGITPGTALRLAKFFGTTPDFWLNFQRRWELYRVQQKEGQEIEKITPCDQSVS